MVCLLEASMAREDLVHRFSLLRGGICVCSTFFKCRDVGEDDDGGGGGRGCARTGVEEAAAGVPVGGLTRGFGCCWAGDRC